MAAFIRFKEVGLVRFHNAVKVQWLSLGQFGQKTMTPAERGVLVNPAVLIVA